MKNNILYLVLLLTFLSCTKDQGVPGPAGPQGPAGANGKGSATDTASIFGKLDLVNEFSVFQNDASHVVVTLSSGSQQQTQTTDSTGHYIFSGIATETYDLSFAKPGYGTMKIFGLSHFGGGTLGTQAGYVLVEQIPVKTAPDTFILVSNNSVTTGFDLHLDTSSLTYQQFSENMIVFISKNKTVGPTDYITTMANLSIIANPDGTGGYTINFNKSNVPTPTTPVAPGDTLYAVAYTYNPWVHDRINPQSNGFGGYGTSSYYIDPTTGKTVYPNLSKPSNVVKFAY
jgi:hypothetical protein